MSKPSMYPEDHLPGQVRTITVRVPATPCTGFLGYDIWNEKAMDWEPSIPLSWRVANLSIVEVNPPTGSTRSDT